MKILTFCCYCLLAQSLINSAEAITVYLVRHAEKQLDNAADKSDPGLTEAGIKRAETAADILAAIDFTAIYSSDYQRTRLTAETIKGKRSQAVQIYDPRKLEQFAEELKSAPADSVFLVVGHSNTTPTLTHSLSGKPVSAIDESVYHNLYRVGIAADGSTTLDLLSIPPISNSAPVQALRLNADWISPGKQTFQMLLNGKPVGESTWQYSFNAHQQYGEVLTLKELTQLPEYNVDATIEVIVDKQTLQPIAMTASGPMFGQSSQINANFNGQQISGSSEYPRQPFEPQGTLNLEQTIDQPYFERTAAIMLASAVPATIDTSFGFYWYNTYNDELRIIQVDNLGTQTVTVPAGTFATDMIRYQGGAPSQVFYVSRQAPRKVVKIEVLGSPWVYELL